MKGNESRFPYVAREILLNELKKMGRLSKAGSLYAVSDQLYNLQLNESSKKLPLSNTIENPIDRGLFFGQFGGNYKLDWFIESGLYSKLRDYGNTALFFVSLANVRIINLESDAYAAELKRCGQGIITYREGISSRGISKYSNTVEILLNKDVYKYIDKDSLNFYIALIVIVYGYALGFVNHLVAGSISYEDYINNVLVIWQSVSSLGSNDAFACLNTYKEAVNRILY